MSVDWPGIVTAVAPALLSLIPNFPLALIPVITAAIVNAEKALTNGQDKKLSVTAAVTAVNPNVNKFDLSKGIDAIVQAANSAHAKMQ